MNHTNESPKMCPGTLLGGLGPKFRRQWARIAQKDAKAIFHDSGQRAPESVTARSRGR